MTALRAVCLLLAVLSLAFAPAPFPKPERRGKPAAPPIEGLWQGGSTIEITATRLTYHPRQTPIEYVLVVNPHVTPATYDIRRATNQGKNWDYQGIYRIEGDTLTLCYNSGEKRPTSFDGPGKGTFTEVYKRVPR